MNVLFIWTDITTVDAPRIHLGLTPLSAVLKRQGHKVGILHYRRMPTKAELAESIRGFEPGLLAFSAKTGQWPACREIAVWADAITDAPILFGGRHATHESAGVLAVPAIDYVCRGEGEDFLVEFVEALERGDDVRGLRNLAYRDEQGAVVENSLRPLIADLDTLPLEDRELFDYPRILAARGGILSIMAGRGCPYGCSYCAAPEWNTLYRGNGKPVRKHSPAHLVAQVKHWTRKYPQIRRIDFEDDVFALHEPWVREFADRYQTEIGLPFTFLARIEATRRAILEPLRKAGGALIKIGLESGNEWIRKHVLNRTMSNESIREVFAIAHELGYRTQAYVMVGLPDETRAHAEDTFTLLSQIDPDEVSPAIFFPFPGTPLYELAKARGMWQGEYVGDCYQACVIEHPHMSRQEIKRLFHRFTDERVERDVARHPQGDIDLLARFAEAEVESSDLPNVRVSDLGQSFAMRYGLFSSARTRVRYRLPAGPSGSLRLAFGVHPNSEDFPARVRFQVTINGHLALSRTLNVVETPDDRGWHEAELRLTASAETREITLATEDHVAKPPHPVIAWGRPRVDLSPEPALTRA